MNKPIANLVLLFVMSVSLFSFGQSETLRDSITKESSDVFSSDDFLPIKLSYSIKDLKKETNDSTYMKSVMIFQNSEGIDEEINVKLRTRGNYRLKNCYFPPLKLRISKKVAKGTIFEGYKRFKIVMPCINEKDKNDNVIKEYMAYRLYELVSPYYFKTRLITINLEEEQRKKTKQHIMKGFLIEDDSHVAKRLDGNVYDRRVHPLQQEALASVRNCFFQFMIGNTDFSQAYQHNIKLVFVEKNIVPIPYDFDMAGLVNCSYAVVSEIPNEKVSLGSVTDRLYRGFKRDPMIIEQVRQEFLSNQDKMLALVNGLEYAFDDQREFNIAKEYIESFFELISDDKKFRSRILDKQRSN